MATVFEMIINGEIPSTRLYEDDEVLVILDINPVEKGHSLVISKTTRSRKATVWSYPRPHTPTSPTVPQTDWGT